MSNQIQTDEGKEKNMNEVKKMETAKLPYMSLGILLGLIIGLTLGKILFNNPGSGMAFFTGLGMILGTIVDNIEKKRGKGKTSHDDGLKEE